MEIDVHIGHINLAKSFNGAGEHFVVLIEALQKLGVRQYLLVGNVALAKRLDLIAANDITASDAGFAASTNRVTLLDKDGQQESPEGKRKMRSD